MKRALLFAGPSGAGKTSLIEKIAGINPEFEHIFMYMTRTLRTGEKERETKTREELEQMHKKGEVLYLLEKHGVLFGPSTASFHGILDINRTPMIEMSIYDIGIFRSVYKDVLVVYVAPPSKELLEKRLLRDGRGKIGGRYPDSLVEMDSYLAGRFNRLIDLHIVNDEGRLEESANKVVNCFKKSGQNYVFKYHKE